jgi:murein DD-endopeptidase MepM/ murein hydrolase activator NlpD
MRSFVEPSRSRALSGTAIAVLLAAGLAGCASDTGRFNESPFASRSAPPQQEVTGSIQPAPSGRVEAQALPPPRTQSGAPGMGSYQPEPQYAPPPQAQYGRPEYTGSVPPQQGAPNNYSWDGGTAITVAQGDTLEGVARRYNVPVHAIMQANNMTPPAFIQPGQRLVIPRANNPQYGAAPPAAPPATRLTANPGYTPAGPVGGNGIHVVQSGETLYSLSRRYHKQPMLIAQANNVGLDHKVKIGDRVIIPGAGPIAPVAAVKPAPQRVAEVKPKVVKPQGSPGIAPPNATARVVTPAADPAPEPAPQQQQAAPPPAAAAPEATGSAPSFRWPVRGRVNEGFGPRPSGGQNDGINVAVPQGTPIKSAEDGVVAYAGSELKGYGNLVLIRHSNGFVTAYAHASELSVKKGEQVKRGQVIGKSGATGNVTSPQLHFEVRKGATPVDPMQYLQGG